jgi:hypothetical protein
MSRTSTNRLSKGSPIKDSCRRMQASWSNETRRYRQVVANRRQQTLWEMLMNEHANLMPEGEILAIGAPSMADLARFAG